ncbi:MAG: hypothetical protein GY719_38080 [bacterium]|nr:hypothetical protein [bacterium]
MDAFAPPTARNLRKLIATLLRYVMVHPEAKDTVEGIHHWWLPQGGGEFRRDEVEAALDDLVARGCFFAHTVGPRTIYGARPEWLGAPAENAPDSS